MKKIFSILFAVVLVVSFSLIPAALAGASPGPGLAGLWHLDEGTGTTASDSSGNGNTGTLTNGPIWVSGKFGQALSFDGIDDYVDFGNIFNFGTGQSFTAECWIKTTVQPTLRTEVMGIYAGPTFPTPNQFWAIFLEDTGKASFWLRVSNNVAQATVWGTTDVTDGQWHHIAAVKDVTSGKMRLFVDGFQEGGDVAFTDGPTSNNYPFRLGDGHWGRYYNGIIDEARIWDVAMTPGPVTVPLLADQNINVGTVSVWNDANDLHVKYETTGGWEITKTHLAVADNPGDIPQNRAGNPKVGQFPHSTSHATPVTTYTYTIPLPSGTPLYIAAHAKVEKLSDVVMTATLASGVGTDNVLVIAENTTNPSYPLGYPGPYGGTPTPSVMIQGTLAAYSGWPTIAGAQWISDSLANPGSANSWRLFTRNFSIPSNATNISGTLQIDSDNAEGAKVNSSPAAGLVYGEVYGAFHDDGEWNWVQSWPVGSYLQPGLNTLEVMVRNYFWVPSPGMWNYAGLVYKIDYEYQLLTTETAWGDGERFVPRGNWATYFEYHVQ